MYIPHYYKNEDLKEVKKFIKENSFGILINQVDGKPWATHIPLELDSDEDGKDILHAEIIKNLNEGDVTSKEIARHIKKQSTPK